MHKVAPISLLCCGFSFGLRVEKWAGQQQYFDREMAISSDLGPFCANLGISREYLLEGNTNSLPKLPTAELLVNGLVYAYQNMPMYNVRLGEYFFLLCHTAKILQD